MTPPWLEEQEFPEGNDQQQDGLVTGAEENLDLTPAVIPQASD